MSIPQNTKDTALNALTVTALSLHTQWPGVTGANEISGGSPAYARQSIALAASSGGRRIASATALFDVPATTVRWLGLWNGSTFVGAMANGGAAPKNFTVMPVAGLVVASAHGYANGDKVAFFNGTPPGGLTEGTVYFVRDVSTDSFKVAATSGGAAVTLTSGSSFACVVCAVVEDAFAGQGVHQITSVTIAIPD